MAHVCFDTHVLIWGVKNEASPSQQAMIERARALIQQCTDRKDTVLVPAVVVGEAFSVDRSRQRQGWVQPSHRRLVR